MKKRQIGLKLIILIILSFCLSGCGLSVQTKQHNFESQSQQPSPPATPTPFESKNPRANQAAQLLTKGELQVEADERCQNYDATLVDESKYKVKIYRVNIASGQQRFIVEDYLANRGGNERKEKPYIDQSVYSQFIVTAKAGQKMALEILPPTRKDIQDNSGSLYLQTYAPNCEKILDEDLVRGNRQFTLKLTETGDYTIIISSSGTSETNFRLKVTIK